MHRFRAQYLNMQGSFAEFPRTSSAPALLALSVAITAKISCRSGRSTLTIFRKRGCSTFVPEQKFAPGTAQAEAI